MKVKIILENKEFSSNEIIVTLYDDIAPISVANFIKLVKQRYYDGIIFHRVIKDFMIQTGGFYIKNNELMKKEEVETIKGEFTTNGVPNYLKHTLGVISMARTSIKDSATSQFFLCATDCPHLDGSYAAFGMAEDEMSQKVIEEISNVKTGRLSSMFSDFPYTQITIKTIEIVE